MKVSTGFGITGGTVVPPLVDNVGYRWVADVCTPAELAAVSPVITPYISLVKVECNFTYLGVAYTSGSQIIWDGTSWKEIESDAVTGGINIGTCLGEDLFAGLSSSGVLQFKRLTSSDGSVTFTSSTSTCVDLKVANAIPTLCQILDGAMNTGCGPSPCTIPSIQTCITNNFVPYLEGQIPHSWLINDEPQRHAEINDMVGSGCGIGSFSTVFSSMYVNSNFMPLGAAASAGYIPCYTPYCANGKTNIAPTSIKCSDLVAINNSFSCILPLLTSGTFPDGATIVMNQASGCWQAGAAGGGGGTVTVSDCGVVDMTATTVGTNTNITACITPSTNEGDVLTTVGGVATWVQNNFVPRYWTTKCQDLTHPLGLWTITLPAVGAHPAVIYTKEWLTCSLVEYRIGTTILYQESTDCITGCTERINIHPGLATTYNWALSVTF